MGEKEISILETNNYLELSKEQTIKYLKDIKQFFLKNDCLFLNQTGTISELNCSLIEELNAKKKQIIKEVKTKSKKRKKLRYIYFKLKETADIVYEVVFHEWNSEWKVGDTIKFNLHKSQDGKNRVYPLSYCPPSPMTQLLAFCYVETIENQYKILEKQEEILNMLKK